MRIGLIGDNSMEFVSILIEIWNMQDCAVIIDWRIPFKSAESMLNDAGVEKCYMSSEYFENQNIVDCNFEIETYHGTKHIEYLNLDVINKFHNNYSQDEALILYSSGTTGKAKGIILTHYAINKNADAIIKYMNINKNDCIYIIKTLAHASTIVGELLVGLKQKVNIVLSPTISSVSTNLLKMKEFNASIVCMNPTLLHIYITAQSARKIEFDCLHTIYTSGSILNSKDLFEAKKVFNHVNILNVYGLTEAGPRVSAQTSDNDNMKPACVGKAIEGVQIKIINNNGNDVTEYENGIILVKSVSRCKGYVKGNLTHKLTNNEWLNTGDIGYFDCKGNLFITGRTDNMIQVGSHNIYPEEIESYILSLDYIDDCVIIPQKNTIYGQKMICFYVTDKDYTEDIIQYCRKTMASYEIPDKYIKVDKMIVNKNGKKVRDLEVYKGDYDGLVL